MPAAVEPEVKEGIDKMSHALIAWASFAEFCAERNVKLPLWAALKFEEACRLTHLAMPGDSPCQPQ